MKRLLYIILAALAAASCVYQFEPEGIAVQKRVVIEGDIIIGGETTVMVSCTTPLNFDSEYDYNSPIGEAWIEGEDGSSFYSHRTDPSNYFSFDTREARKDTRYRLHFKDLTTGREYVSTWQEVVPAPDIDKMFFDYDDNNVYLRVSADGHDNSYFKWDYTEDWEYHAEYAPLFRFNPFTWQTERLDMPDYSTYYCWNHSRSTESGLVSTRSQSSNVLDGQVIQSYDRKSLRFQYIYRMDLTMTGLSRDAYDYLHNMKEISNITGSLFAPSPDDMRGNIRCQQDTTEFVIGYISAVEQVKERLYINYGENKFYRSPLPTLLEEPNLENMSILEYYEAGFRPVQEESSESGMGTVVKWGPERCVNCLLFGGSKTRPYDWPNNHR